MESAVYWVSPMVFLVARAEKGQGPVNLIEELGEDVLESGVESQGRLLEGARQHLR